MNEGDLDEEILSDQAPSGSTTKGIGGVNSLALVPLLCLRDPAEITV
jgi:hypothetical protein